MSQAMLSKSPYQNSKLFSGYYLDKRVNELNARNHIPESNNSETTRQNNS